MSQFFRPLSSESEDSESEEEQTQTTAKPRWVDESSDEEEAKRVVVSAKDKRWSAMANICKNIKNHVRISDFVSLVDDFEDLVSQIVKAKSIIESEGVPVFFTRNIIRIENAVLNLPKEEAKKLNPSNNKALNKLKQQIKKHNKAYEAEIEAFRKNPVDSEESSAESVEAEEESSSEEWGSGDSDEASADDNLEYDPNNRRAFWELKEDKVQDKQVEKKQKPKPKKDKDSEETTDAPKVEYNTFVISSKLKEILELRGRRAAVPKTLVETLKEMLAHNTEPALEADILGLLVNFEFEISKNTSVVYMERSLWLDTITHLTRQLKQYLAHPAIFKEGTGERYISLRYSLAQYLERLNEELKKALKNIDSQSSEYVERLQDLLTLSSLSGVSLAFYEAEADVLNLARVALLRLEHLHYLHDDFLAALQRGYAGSETGLYFQVTDSQQTVNELSAKVYQSGDEKMKLQALLMQVYHHAIHGRYIQARELLALRNPSEGLLNDISLQVLYNRAVVQIGLSAFNNGLLQDAFNWLNDIVSTYRVDELLAQSISRKEKTPGQERDDRKRLVPYHMQIKSDIVEAVYFICAILIDIPLMAMNPLDPHKNTHSKYLKRVLEATDRLATVGPPESAKDYIVAAAGALKQGSWADAADSLMRLELWRFIPQAALVKERLLKKIKESALITYILTYADAYESFSQLQLSRLFDISESEVFSLVSRLIYIGQLKASWEGNVIVLDCDVPSKLQFLSNQLTERLTQCAEANEKLMEFRGVFATSLSDISQRRTNLNKRRRVKKQT